MTNLKSRREKLRSRINLVKLTRYAIIVNACQIIAVMLLATYALIKGDMQLPEWVAKLMIIAAAAMVIWGAFLDIREAGSARRAARQGQMLEEAYSQLETLNATLRAQRHDFSNHIQVIYTLNELGDTQSAIEYMDRVYGDIQKVGRALKTASPAVNALIAAKLADCEEQGVQFITDIRTSWADCPVPGWEMCRILGNLIDNAAEAMDPQRERRITVALWEDVRFWHFSVENTGRRIPESIRSDIFQYGFSTKGEGRGTGLHIVKCILEEYGGSMTLTSDGVTCFHGAIPKQQPEA